MSNELVKISRRMVENVLENKKTLYNNVVNSSFGIVDTKNECLELDYVKNNYSCLQVTPLLYDFTVNLLNNLNKELKEKNIVKAVDYYAIEGLPIELLINFFADNWTKHNQNQLRKLNIENELTKRLYVKLGDTYCNLAPFLIVFHYKSVKKGNQGIENKITTTFNFYFAKSVFKPLVTGRFIGDGYCEIPKKLSQNLNTIEYKLFLLSQYKNTTSKKQVEISKEEINLFLNDKARISIKKNKMEEEKVYFKNTQSNQEIYDNLIKDINNIKEGLSSYNLGEYKLINNLYVSDKNIIFHFKTHDNIKKILENKKP